MYKLYKILNGSGHDNFKIMILMIVKITESLILINLSSPITRVGKNLTLKQQLWLVGSDVLKVVQM